MGGGLTQIGGSNFASCLVELVLGKDPNQRRLKLQKQQQPKKMKPMKCWPLEKERKGMHHLKNVQKLPVLEMDLDSPHLHLPVEGQDLQLQLLKLGEKSRRQLHALSKS